MIWTRRSFLKLSAVAAGAVVTAPLEPVLRAVTPVTKQIFMTGFQVRNLSANPAMFTIARDGAPLLSYGIGGHATLWWSAPDPCSALAWSTGLKNQSDIDVEIQYVTFTVDGESYVWTERGTFAVNTAAPPIRWTPFVEEDSLVVA